MINERPLPEGVELTIVYFLTGHNIRVHTTLGGIKNYVDQIEEGMGAEDYAKKLSAEMGTDLRPMTREEIAQYRQEEAEELEKQDELDRLAKEAVEQKEWDYDPREDEEADNDTRY